MLGRRFVSFFKTCQYFILLSPTASQLVNILIGFDDFKFVASCRSSSSREGVIGTGFANDNPLPGYGALTLAGQNGRQHANISSLWSQSNMLDQENAFSQASLLASLGLGMNAADAEQLQTHWGNSSQVCPQM